MKPLNKRVAGSVTILAALALTAIAYFPLVNSQFSVAGRQELSPRNAVQANSGSSIAVADSEIYVVNNGKIMELDRETLTVKKVQSLENLGYKDRSIHSSESDIVTSSAVAE